MDLSYPKTTTARPKHRIESNHLLQTPPRPAIGAVDIVLATTDAITQVCLPPSRVSEASSRTFHG